jgi:predicted metal-binding membrane protein
MPLRLARSRPAALAGLLLAAALAWWWTVGRMAGMGASPGTDLGPLGWFAATWVAMMAAMMLPSFAPTLAAYPQPGPSRMLLCSAGYLLAWTVAGIAAYALYELGTSLVGTQLAWHEGGRWLSAGVLALAAVYELTPMKRDSLRRCRGELARTRGGSLAAGVRSGGWCIACSWALMAALFALGVMSLTWMALVAVLVAVEKTVPRPSAARLATAAVLGVLAAGVLVAPGQVPGLVVPGSGGMHAMRAMS